FPGDGRDVSSRRQRGGHFTECVMEQAAPQTTSPDLSLKGLGVGVALLLVLTLIVAIWMPLPRLFAAPGEDRSLIEPWHPQARLILEQAKAGNVQAMREMANFYLHGGDFPQDIGQAVKWLNKAADVGDVEAMNFLGGLALDGRAGKPNPEKAI